jgi:hypothetical protein
MGDDKLASSPADTRVEIGHMRIGSGGFRDAARP